MFDGGSIVGKIEDVNFLVPTMKVKKLSMQMLLQ